MKAPKSLMLILGLGSCSSYLIASCINSEINMFHAFDTADHSTPAATNTPVAINSSAETNTSVSSETDAETEFSSSSPTADASASESSDTASTEPDSKSSEEPVTSPQASTADPTYTKLVAPAIKMKNGTRPTLDVAFCIDTTSSMQGEIDTVKAKVKSMVTTIAQSKNRPIVRVGLVAYRDNGDDYVTKLFQFSQDIDAVEKSISNLIADGGGDGPEAVDCGMHVAINDLDWRTNKNSAKLLFLIGDAPPHSDNAKYNWRDEAKQAAAKGIHINTIGCDGLDGYEDEGFPLYRKVAQLTNGSFEALSYSREIADSHGHAATLITSGGKSYVMKSTDKKAWKGDIDSLVASGAAAPALQGATNGTIGVAGGDTTYIVGVNTAGTVRATNNLDTVMVDGARSLMSKMGF